MRRFVVVEVLSNVPADPVGRIDVALERATPGVIIQSAAGTQSAAERIEQLNDLKDKGLISEAEYGTTTCIEPNPCPSM